jgi:hypothetical protein
MVDAVSDEHYRAGARRGIGEPAENFAGAVTIPAR